MSGQSRSPLRLVAYLACALIAGSLFAPALAGWLGPVGIGVLLVAVYLQMFKRPVGRPARDPMRRLSGYAVRSSFTAIPEAALLASALWAVGAASPNSTDSAAAGLIGVLLGLGWARLGGISKSAHQVTKGIVGGVGLVASISGLIRGDACAEGLAPAAIVVVGLVTAASLSMAVLVGVLKSATLRQPNAAAYALAMVGLIELVEFAVAPVGESLLEELPAWSALPLVGAALFLAGLAAINPKAVEAMLGVGIAVGATYLLALSGRLELQAFGVDCRSVVPQLVFILAFTGMALLVGTRSHR